MQWEWQPPLPLPNRDENGGLEIKQLAQSEIMKPLQIVKEHCDCYFNGACLGVTINDQLSLVRFRTEGLPCLLQEPMRRCRHFENCVMPMENRTEWAKDIRKSASIASEFKQGAHEYRIRTGFMAETVRLCPQCRVSKIGKGKKLCDKCRDSNKRKSHSEYDHKRHRHSNSTQHSESSSISGVDIQ